MLVLFFDKSFRAFPTLYFFDWWGVVAHEILVSAQGPFLGFWVWAFGVWGLGLTTRSILNGTMVLSLLSSQCSINFMTLLEAAGGRKDNANFLWLHSISAHDLGIKLYKALVWHTLNLDTPKQKH